MVYSHAEMARRAERSGHPASVESLMAELLPQAKGLAFLYPCAMFALSDFTAEEIPVALRQEIMGVIRKLLERQIDFS